MIAALDVGYKETENQTRGRCGVVAFTDWTDEAPAHELAVPIENVAPYVSGSFYQRELPCLLAGLEALEQRTNQPVDLVVIDGNVRLDNHGKPGLGRYLFDALNKTVPIIGVAKNPFGGLTAVEILRGTSRRPLHVTAVGIDEAKAAALIQSMRGDFRLPTLLRRADELSKLTNDSP